MSGSGDFYVVLGRTDKGRYRWPIAYDYGLLSAGGGSRYWTRLQNLKMGDRVFAYVARAGYVGIGIVVGEMTLARDAMVDIAGESQPLLSQPGMNAEFKARALSDDLEIAERVVPVDWLAKRRVSDAFWEKGMFSSRLVACGLSDANTVAAVEIALGIQ